MVSALTPAWAADVIRARWCALWPSRNGLYRRAPAGQWYWYGYLRQMLGRAGYQLELVWLPWTRAVRDGSA